MTDSVSPGADCRALLAAACCPAESFQVVPARVFRQRWHPPSDVALPLLVTEVRNADLECIQSCLAQAYPADHRLHWVSDPDRDCPTGVAVTNLAGQGRPACSETLCVPPLTEESSLQSLADVLARLRAPGGCPWDQEQTLESMRIQILSEVHEVIAAIDMQDDANLQEELGDLLMDTLFLVHIALTAGKFQLADVVAGICRKMIRRHPHVYGDGEQRDSAAVLRQWDEIKRAEKAASGQSEAHPMDGIPESLPALETTREILSKAAKRRIALPDVGEPHGTRKWTEETLGIELWRLVREAAADGIAAETALRKRNSQILSGLREDFKAEGKN